MKKQPGSCAGRRLHTLSVWAGAAAMVAGAGAIAAVRPAVAAGTGVAEYPTTQDAQPQWITSGPDGAAWFTEPGKNQIGRISPSGALTEYQVPDEPVPPWKYGLWTSNGYFPIPQGITAGPDGNLWFVQDDMGNGNIGRITPAGVITLFVATPPPPTVYGTSSAGITVGPDKNLWFSEGDHIGRMAPQDTQAGLSIQPAQITHFPIPSAVVNQNGGVPDASACLSGSTACLPGGWFVTDITAGPDGALWFLEQNTSLSGGRIGRMSVTGDVTAEYPLKASPNRIVAGPDGNLWFTQEDGGIGHITPAGVITVWSYVSTAARIGIAVGPDHSIWIAENDDPQTLHAVGGTIDYLDRVDVKGELTRYRVGQSHRLGGLTVLGGSNIVCFTGDGQVFYESNSDPDISSEDIVGLATPQLLAASAVRAATTRVSSSAPQQPGSTGPTTATTHRRLDARQACLRCR